jgi:hypothetical protein
VASCSSVPFRNASIAVGAVTPLRGRRTASERHSWSKAD